MTPSEYAKQSGITRQAAMKHCARGRWIAGDGTPWGAYLKKGKWQIEREAAAPGLQTDQRKPATPDALKAKKMIEEIRLLQNRNERLRSDLLKDWGDCLHRAAAGMFGAMAGKLMALRLDKELAGKIDSIVQEEAGTIEARLNEEIEAYEVDNRVRLR